MKSKLYNSCLRKKRYDTGYLAGEVAAKRMKENSGTLFVYSCAYCSGWHLTRARYINLDEEILEELLGWVPAEAA